MVGSLLVVGTEFFKYCSKRTSDSLGNRSRRSVVIILIIASSISCWKKLKNHTSSMSCTRQQEGWFVYPPVAVCCQQSACCGRWETTLCRSDPLVSCTFGGGRLEENAMWMETSGQQTKPKNDIIYTTLLTLVFWKEILVPRVCLGTIPKTILFQILVARKPCWHTALEVARIIQRASEPSCDPVRLSSKLSRANILSGNHVSGSTLQAGRCARFCWAAYVSSKEDMMEVLYGEEWKKVRATNLWQGVSSRVLTLRICSDGKNSPELDAEIESSVLISRLLKMLLFTRCNTPSPLLWKFSQPRASVLIAATAYLDEYWYLYLVKNVMHAGLNDK